MTLRAAVIGSPINHSLSPALHGYWLKKFAIDGVYEACRVEPDKLSDFIGAMKREGYVGVNVTLPHKEAVVGLCDEVSEVARIVGAVNTIWLEGDKICGDNTDVVGFTASLDFAPRRAVLLGAGGAARAVLYGLLDLGVEEVRIVNRTVARAEALAREFASYGKISVMAGGDWEAVFGDCDLLVNCSSAGLSGGLAGEGEDLPDFALLGSGAMVYDITYAPYETEFLRAAKGEGLAIRHGLDMLIHQAVPGFCRWFSPVEAPDPKDIVLRDYLVGLL